MHRVWAEHCTIVHETARHPDKHVTLDDLALLLVYLSEGTMTALEDLTAETASLKGSVTKVLDLQAQQTAQIAALEAAVAQAGGDNPAVVAAVNDLKQTQSQIDQVLAAHAPAPDNQGTTPTSPGIPQTVPADTTGTPAPDPSGSETVPVGGGDPVPVGSVPEQPAPADPGALDPNPTGAPAEQPAPSVPEPSVPPVSTPDPGTLDPDPTTVTTAPAPDDGSSPFAAPPA